VQHVCTCRSVRLCAFARADPLSGGGCFVYTFFYSSPEQQEQQQKQQQLLLQQQQEEEEESEQEEEEYNDCTPDLDSIMWEKKPPNRARIAFPFSSIRGLAFDGQSYAVHFQLTEPPRTWVGTQVWVPWGAHLHQTPQEARLGPGHV